MGVFSLVFGHPATWGFAGAFIYAGPRWATCMVACWQDREPLARCHVELIVALACGALAAAAFAAVVLAVAPAPMKDANAIAAALGLLVNPTTPVLTRRISSIVGSALAARVDDSLPKDPS